jgi:hypothetical protein
MLWYNDLMENEKKKVYFGGITKIAPSKLVALIMTVPAVAKGACY